MDERIADRGLTMAVERSSRAPWWSSRNIRVPIREAHYARPSLCSGVTIIVCTVVRHPRRSSIGVGKRPGHGFVGRTARATRKCRNRTRSWGNVARCSRGRSPTSCFRMSPRSSSAPFSSCSACSECSGPFDKSVSTDGPSIPSYRARGSERQICGNRICGIASRYRNAPP